MVHAELVIEGCNVPLRTFVIRPGQRFEVGRTGTSIVLQGDTTVSRRHAQFELKADGALFVADLNSRNGTFLAGVQLQPYCPTRVEDGMVVRIGKHSLHPELHEDDGTRSALSEVKRRDEPLVRDEELELLGVLGTGSFGRVYAAHQKLMDRRVAVKFLHSRARPGDLERFLREGRLACRVRSPHVVEVYDFRVSGDRVYLLMELVDGGTLKDRLQRGPPIPVPEALNIASQVAHGLAAVHLEGVVHRDIKPSNILMAPDGVIKLSDFGIAKDVRGDPGLTPHHAAMGSLPYVAPEQAVSASAVDERVDVYGLGATLYHMLTGRPPFGGAQEVVMQVVDEVPAPVVDLAPHCPVNVRRLVEAMIHKDPAVRPPTAASVARQLEELSDLHYPAFVAGAGRPDEGSAQTSSFPGVFVDEPLPTSSSSPDQDDASPLLETRH